MKKILKEVLEEITPTKEAEKKIKEKVNRIIKKINHGLDAKAILGGSGAKGTWLQTFDADIFVKFNYKKYKGKNISDILGKKLKKKFKIQRLHGSRDYFRIKDGSLTIEIVPILNIKNPRQAENITDMSPLHSTYVNKFKLQGDIRLLKQFCRAQRCYGAESYIKGFSGYVCELLTIHYKGFKNVIRKAAKWEPKVILDPANFYNKKHILFKLNKSKITGPLVIVDPVQKERNAAAAISEEKFNRFVAACKEFLKKPAASFFAEKEITTTELKKKAKGKQLILLALTPKRGKEDVVGAKIVKVVDFLTQKIKEHDFDLIEADWQWDKKAVLWFIIKGTPEKSKTLNGPPTRMKSNVKKFKKKYKNTFTKGNRIYATIKRKYTDPKKLVRDTVKEKYVKERVKDIKINI